MTYYPPTTQHELAEGASLVLIDQAGTGWAVCYYCGKVKPVCCDVRTFQDEETDLSYSEAPACASCCADWSPHGHHRHQET